MKIYYKILFFLFFIAFDCLFAQRHLNGESYGPIDMSVGLKCLLIGGVVWAIGMLIGLSLRKTENNVIADGQSFLTTIVGIFCIGGMIIIVAGLIFMGFG
jgi:hypothetical protein